MQGDAGTFALRTLRPDEHESALAEERAMDLARAAGTPVPRVLATGTSHRRPVMLLSWCNGETLSRAMHHRPWEAFRLGLACGRAQARLHQATAPEETGSTPWLTRFGPLDQELLRRLEAVASRHVALLHLDCHGDNVLVGGGQVTGLIDWTNACAGDSRADVARTWSLLTRPSSGGARGRAGEALRRLLAAGWQRGYEQVAGAQHDMLLFRIWALTGLLHTTRDEAGRAGTAFESAALGHQLGRMRQRAGLPPVGAPS